MSIMLIKNIKGYEENYTIDSNGMVFLKKKNRYSKQGINHYGYRQINIKGKIKLVHRLVAEHFLKPEYGKTDVNHKNGNKLDNTIDNLEWCTRSENVIHQWKNGLCDIRGEKNYNSKLTEEMVLKIRELYSSGEYSQQKIADMFKISQAHVKDIVKRYKWKHI